MMARAKTNLNRPQVEYLADTLKDSANVVLAALVVGQFLEISRSSDTIKQYYIVQVFLQKVPCSHWFLLVISIGIYPS